MREQQAREEMRLAEMAQQISDETELRQQQAEKIRRKQEQDIREREQRILFDLEAERKRNEKIAMEKAIAEQSTESKTIFTSVVNQSQKVWPPVEPPTPKQQIPIITTDCDNEVADKFQFQPLDENTRSFMAAIRPPSTCYSPPTDEKPFPSIPYYQQHLAFYEAQPEHSGVFDPKHRPITPNRSRSPAFGPPPNPLLAYVPKRRDPDADESGKYLCGGKLMSPIWYGDPKNMPMDIQKKLLSVRPGLKAEIETFHFRKQKKQETSSVKTSQDERNNQSQQIDNETKIPKGIVANQVRRLSGDGQSLPGFKSNDNDKQSTNETKSSASTNNTLQVPSSYSSASNTNPKNDPNTGSAGTPGAVPKHGRTFTCTGPNRGQGVLSQPVAGGRIPICGSCGSQIRWEWVFPSVSLVCLCKVFFSIACFFHI